MAKPTLCASENAKKKANNAFDRSGKTQEFIAGKAGTTRQRVANFLDGANVERHIFIDICEALKLDWREIAGIEDEVDRDDVPKDIEALVKLARERCAEDIRKRCGTMRVLDMEQPIALNEIYTDVNILEKLTRNQRKSVEELLEKFRVDNFYRWGLADQKQRIQGIKAVHIHSKLMILGKPGAGKTTFLKFLALACIDGKLFEDRLPIFVTLKDFADTENISSLLSFISRQVEQYGISEVTQLNRGFFDSLLNRDINVVETLLRKGKVLVLLDGLDEVREKEDERVLREIREFAQRYIQSTILVTCRINAKEYTFEQFTDVEIADFDKQQICIFANNWFRLKQVDSKDFLNELEKYQGIQELANSPLLLTLLCLAFEESGSFPANRSELYKEGLDALLRKWDSKRGIRRDSVYKDLSIQKKEDMLSQIALITFNKGDYFIKQKQLEEYISNYIRNTANARTDADALLLDSEIVLRSIEAQHGLLVERVRGIYSFSHLTFHEYFAAREIVISTSPSKLETALQNLVTHVTDKRWREVILLSVSMAREADDLLLLIKHEIDNILGTDEKLQNFVGWIDKKSRSVNTPYKLVAVRSYYFALDRAFTPLSSLDQSLDRDLALNFALDHDRPFDQERKYDEEYVISRARSLSLHLAGASEINFKTQLATDIAIDLTIANTYDKACKFKADLNPRYFEREKVLIFIRKLERDIKSTLFHAKESNDQKLYQSLLDLLDLDLEFQTSSPKKTNLDSESSGSIVPEWLIERGEAIVEDVKQLTNRILETQNINKWIESWNKIMVEHRNIGHDWQFSKEQKHRLLQYYDANRLLVECLKSDCYISRETRQEIEESLLMPSKK